MGKRWAENWYQKGKERKRAFQDLALSRKAMESKAKHPSSIPLGFMILP